MEEAPEKAGIAWHEKNALKTLVRKEKIKKLMMAVITFHAQTRNNFPSFFYSMVYKRVER
jgi:hypothetical protein